MRDTTVRDAEVRRAVADVAPNLTVCGVRRVTSAVLRGSPRTPGDVARLIGDTKVGRALSAKEVGAIARHIAPLVLTSEV